MVKVPRPENIVDADDVLMVETQQDLDFPQRALAIRLVLEGADFLDGYALVRHVVQSRAGWMEGCGKRHRRTDLILHTARFTHNDVIRNEADASLQEGRWDVSY